MITIDQYLIISNALQVLNNLSISIILRYRIFYSEFQNLLTYIRLFPPGTPCIIARTCMYACTHVSLSPHRRGRCHPLQDLPTRPSRSSFALKGGTECTVPHVHSRMILTHVCTPTGYDPRHGTRMRAAWCILGYRECTSWTVVNAHIQGVSMRTSEKFLQYSVH